MSRAFGQPTHRRNVGRSSRPWVPTATDRTSAIIVVPLSGEDANAALKLTPIDIASPQMSQPRVWVERLAAVKHPAIVEDRHFAGLEGGRLLIERSRMLLELNDEIFATLRARGTHGSVRLGAPEAYAHLFVPQVLARFAATNPTMTIELSHAPSCQLVPSSRQVTSICWSVSGATSHASGRSPNCGAVR
ncbi:hypothetical protein BQ8482_310087 [Mesorhizobium delmotii]|uniref:LysR substrate-binding domain-containing protein n=1 Tax=Mesorhizobium delmotii TaxID=1631247 RepID=A0A2P9ANQ3_9HYPH|nr:hypothetical protein BQ8482_310087 [Mesorhizobium delmotii]